MSSPDTVITLLFSCCDESRLQPQTFQRPTESWIGRSVFWRVALGRGVGKERFHWLWRCVEGGWLGVSGSRVGFKVLGDTMLWPKSELLLLSISSIVTNVPVSSVLSGVIFPPLKNRYPHLFPKWIAFSIHVGKSGSRQSCRFLVCSIQPMK